MSENMAGEPISTYAKVVIPPEEGLLSFAIVGENAVARCFYKPGMTWGQWLGSKYDNITTEFNMEEDIYIDSNIGWGWLEHKYKDDEGYWDTSLTNSNDPIVSTYWYILVNAN